MESQAIKTVWYIICNPTSGGGIPQKKISQIISILKQVEFDYEFCSTAYPHHEELLVKNAIQKGYSKFICIGGDGTIHYMINGIMKQKKMSTQKIRLAVIPAGTGNDWVKNYRIPTDPKQAIQLIIHNKTIYQDIGKISLFNEEKEVFFNNAAGIGFDAYIVKHIALYKKWGSMAYILAALKGFSAYTAGKISFNIRSKTKTKESAIFLMTLGICKFSGGGMQLTDFQNHKSGYLDLTLIKPIGFFKVLSQINKLYNGKIAAVKESYCTHVEELTVTDNNSCLIQADGELIGEGRATFSLHKKAVQFVVL